MATASGNSANLGWKKRSLCLPCKGSRPRCSQLREFAGSGARRKRLSPREPVCRRHPLSAGSVEPDAHREGEQSHPQGHRCPAPATRAEAGSTQGCSLPPPRPHRCPGRVPTVAKPPVTLRLLILVKIQVSQERKPPRTASDAHLARAGSFTEGQRPPSGGKLGETGKSNPLGRLGQSPLCTIPHRLTHCLGRCWMKRRRG